MGKRTGSEEWKTMKKKKEEETSRVEEIEDMRMGMDAKGKGKKPPA